MDVVSRVHLIADHPRIRGEHFQGLWELIKGAGSSPHTRGALRDPPDHLGDAGIIPAYAGSTRSRSAPPRGLRGSSPHTRGAPTPLFTGTVDTGIIPAYAGSTGLCNLGPEATPDHPRIRGEHP